MQKMQRQEEIMALLQNRHAVGVRELAEKLYASEPTIRRDLAALERRGLIQRIFGGACLVEQKQMILPLDVRVNHSTLQKEKIAAAAVKKYVRDNGVLLIDASSTAQMMIPYLKDFRRLVVVSNCLRATELLAGTDVKIYCTGGELLPNARAFAGTFAENMLRQLHADVLFFSCQGLSLDGRLTDPSEPETRLRQVMLRSVRKRVLLCDSTKIGKRFFFDVCGAEELDDIICDQPLPEELRRLLPGKEV